MFFLLRMAFWLGLVLVLLPSGSSQQPQGSQVAASEAISAASAAAERSLLWDGAFTSIGHGRGKIRHGLD